MVDEAKRGAARDGKDKPAARADGIDRSCRDVGDNTASDPRDEDVEEILWVTIEIPRGSRNKYEYDDALGRFRLDRTLHSSVVYPTDYGFVPDTLAADGDHLDVLVVVEEPTFPGCLVPARVIGLLDMEDDKGQDDKVLAVPVGDPRFLGVRKLRTSPGTGCARSRPSSPPTNCSRTSW